MSFNLLKKTNKRKRTTTTKKHIYEQIRQALATGAGRPKRPFRVSNQLISEFLILHMTYTEILVTFFFPLRDSYFIVKK